MIVCTSYLKELLSGVHADTDTYKVALFSSSATLDASTTAYSTTNEITGTGYTAGGETLSGFATSSGSGKAWLDFSDPSWSTATITARYALIYNSSKSNKAVAVIDFGTDKSSTAGTFSLVFPTADATNALLRLNGN